MLQKRRDIASLPDGLQAVATDIRKGRAVIRKLNGTKGVFELALPGTALEAADCYGFVTLHIEDNLHSDSYFDTIKAGKKAVVYTFVKNEEWATTEFVGPLVLGDKCAIGYGAEDAGKVIKAVGEVVPVCEVVAVTPAMGGYEEAMITVKLV